MRDIFRLINILMGLIALLDGKQLAAQEFSCSVNINDEQLEGTSYDYVKQALATELTTYINDFRWTETEVLEFESINCQISIVLTSATTDYTYSAEAVISARRPIYGTMQETMSIILNDQAWQFSYPEGRSLVHDELTFEALTSFIDYYAYLMLGYDFDSFAELGGSDYFAKAQDVVDLAQSSNAIGWARSSNNRRNRFTLVADLMNSSYDDLRQHTIPIIGKLWTALPRIQIKPEMPLWKLWNSFKRPSGDRPVISCLICSLIQSLARLLLYSMMRKVQFVWEPTPF